jgi:hypothetical protein
MIALSLFSFIMFLATPVRAENNIERAGMVLAQTAGNVLFVPLKTISVAMGLVSGALSFVVTGGDREITDQLWHNATEGPYLITAEVASRAVGQRPELLEPPPLTLPH